MAAQRRLNAAPQDVVLGERGGKRVGDGMFVGDVAQASAGDGERTDPRGGGEQDGQERLGGEVLGAAQFQMGLEGLNGIAIDLGGWQGIEGLTHRTLRECSGLHKPFSEEKLSLSSPGTPLQADLPNY